MVHLFAYLAVVLLLFFVNLTVNAESVVVLLGGARLGHRRRLSPLVRLRQAAETNAAAAIATAN
jgi:hypothetical protein